MREVTWILGQDLRGKRRRHNDHSDESKLEKRPPEDWCCPIVSRRPLRTGSIDHQANKADDEGG